MSGIQAPPGQVEMLTSIPPGIGPGQGIQTTTPDGQVLTFMVPDDFVPGQMIPVFYTPLVGRQPTNEIGVEPPPQAPQGPSKHEMRIMMRTFGDAKDKWKVDGQTLKGFYLHSESGFLYTWDQASGTLYEFRQATGQCQAVWTSKVPGLNAEIWTVLPLPPTDPASLQANQAQSGVATNADAYLILTIAHEAGTQLPADVLEAARDDFCTCNEFDQQATRTLKNLPPAGQFFAIQNFRGSAVEDGVSKSRAFTKFVDKITKRPRPPWGNSACTLIVSGEGAIIGRSCPDLDALCRDDPPNRLAQAHCKIMSEQDRFFVCDMNTAVEATLLDGAPVSDDWIGPLKTGSLITIGPLRIKLQLSDMALDTPMPSNAQGVPSNGQFSDDEACGSAPWQQKIYKRNVDDEKACTERRRLEYKDRAEVRRAKNQAEAGSIAVDTLVKKFDAIRKAEEAAAAAEDARIEMPTAEAFREANMGIDGSFLGGGDNQRAGIGFHSQFGAELIPNVADPRSLSGQDAKRMKTQQRFDQAHGRG